MDATTADLIRQLAVMAFFAFVLWLLTRHN
jgi:hypothetical protein